MFRKKNDNTTVLTRKYNKLHPMMLKVSSALFILHGVQNFEYTFSHICYQQEPMVRDARRQEDESAIGQLHLEPDNNDTSGGLCLLPWAKLIMC